MTAKFTIALDCAPGYPRPRDLLPGVLKDTGITLNEEKPQVMLMGHWEWVIPDAQTAAYEKARDTIKARITCLYHGGLIRYGSW